MTDTVRRARGISRPRREPSPELAEMIRSRLEESKMSRSQLARDAGLSQGYVSKLVAGTEAPPSEPMIRDLATILELDPDVMLFAANMIPRWMELAILELDPVEVREVIETMQRGEEVIV
jgi:transcriptional regulator with XRE-family HTH domain